MKRGLRRGIVAGAALACVLAALHERDLEKEALGQTRTPRVSPTSRRPTAPLASAAAPYDAGSAFRIHFGIELATNLLRSPDADERLRGIERAADIGGPEARHLLEQSVIADRSERNSASDPITDVAWRDGRSLIAAIRGLAKEALEEARNPKTAAPPPRVPVEPKDARADAGRLDTTRVPGLVDKLKKVFDATPVQGRPEPTRTELVEFARAITARALAVSDDPRAIDALVASAREIDTGRPTPLAALAALRSRAMRQGVLDLLVWPNLSPQVITLAGEVGDLRAIEPLEQVIRASDARLRAAAIIALGELGAPNASGGARLLLKDSDPSVRLAAAATLVRVGAPDAAPVVAALLADDSTFERAIALAERTESAEVDRVLLERARRPGEDDVRRRMLTALARHHSDAAALALASLVADPVLRTDAVGALGRSRSPNAEKLLESLARDPATRRLGIRGLVLHVLVQGVDRDAALALSRPLATTGVVVDRALFIFAHVALGALSVETGVRERDADARVAAVMGALAHLDERSCRAISTRRGEETDPTVRTLLALSFACEGGAEGASSAELWARARNGGPDAPLSWTVLGARAHDRDNTEIYSFLGSGDAVIRSHLARGLGASKREDAPGGLARALLYEADPNVRRALVRALAEGAGRETPSGREALDLTAAWDPEDDIRALAQSARTGEPLPRLQIASETAWLRLATVDGGGGGAQLAAVVRSDGVAVPIAFDADGFALVPGLPPGAVHLVLAPRLPRLQSP
jgi:HEAT repeat protein